MSLEIHIESSLTKQKTTNKSAQLYYIKDKKELQALPQSYRTVCETKANESDYKAQHGEVLHIEREENGTMVHVFVVGLGNKDLTESQIRTTSAQIIRMCRDYRTERLYVHCDPIDQYIEQAAEGLVLGNYSFDAFKSKDFIKKHPPVREIVLLTLGASEKKKTLIKQAQQRAEAVCHTRDLVNTPASHVHPSTLVETAFSIGKMSGGRVEVQVLDEQECKQLGMGSFLGVAQGSERKPAFIILHYKGNGKKKFAFVGKSITFDSGGLSLKPADSMMDMKMDMAGGATVLGVFTYLATTKPNVAFSDVYGILPACENMPSGSAVKPGDVVTALNGKTIEVLNTDAEGRLTLADGLVYAEKHLKADYILDMATLTGACMVALGTDLAGLFSNNSEFTSLFKKSALASGDEYWELPLYPDYAKQMKSHIADLKNIGGGRYGGAITAAVFLKEFVDKAKWIHIDIAGPAHRDGEAKGVSPKGGTGWGVLSVIHLLEHFS